MRSMRRRVPQRCHRRVNVTDKPFTLFSLVLQSDWIPGAFLENHIFRISPHLPSHLMLSVKGVPGRPVRPRSPLYLFRLRSRVGLFSYEPSFLRGGRLLQPLRAYPIPLPEKVHDGRNDIRTDDQRVYQDGKTEGEPELLHHRHR